MTVCNSLTSWTHSSDWHFKFSSVYFHLLCIFYSIASLDSVQSNLRINSELIPKGSNLQVASKRHSHARSSTTILISVDDGDNVDEDCDDDLEDDCDDDSFDDDGLQY